MTDDCSTSTSMMPVGDTVLTPTLVKEELEQSGADQSRCGATSALFPQEAVLFVTAVGVKWGHSQEHRAYIKITSN